ncbi:MAG: zf-HC2 domain-containing protein, partial [Actinomycetota bacterium]|nr:zf-HC2 domain-containing protein [Actinomycetota bacterium]
MCTELCGAQAGEAAVQQILGGGLPGNGPARDELLARTLTIAAEHTPASRSSGWRGLLAAEHQSECDEAPRRLAARANGKLSPREVQQLDHHLTGCERCRELEGRFTRAEEAFGAALEGGSAGSWLPTGVGGGAAVASGAAALGGGAAPLASWIPAAGTTPLA